MHITFEKLLPYIHKQCFHEQRAFIGCFTVVQSINLRAGGQEKNQPIS